MATSTEPTGADEEAECNGVCHRASEVGVSLPGDPVAYPHLSCPEHGNPAAWITMNKTQE